MQSRIHNLKNYLQQVKYQGLMGMIPRNSVPHISKFMWHATRKRIGDHSHYPIFAVCNSNGKNPGNVWEVSTKAHYGNEHFAIFLKI